MPVARGRERKASATPGMRCPEKIPRPPGRDEHQTTSSHPFGCGSSRNIHSRGTARWSLANPGLPALRPPGAWSLDICRECWRAEFPSLHHCCITARRGGLRHQENVAQPPKLTQPGWFSSSPPSENHPGCAISGCSAIFSYSRSPPLLALMQGGESALPVKILTFRTPHHPANEVQNPRRKFGFTCAKHRNKCPNSRRPPGAGISRRRLGYLALTQN